MSANTEVFSDGRCPWGENGSRTGRFRSRVVHCASPLSPLKGNGRSVISGALRNYSRAVRVRRRTGHRHRREDVRGVQLGLGNYVLGDVTGVQMACYSAPPATRRSDNSIVNWVEEHLYTARDGLSTRAKHERFPGQEYSISRGDVSGYRFSSVVNTAGGAMDGVDLDRQRPGKSRDARLGVLGVSVQASDGRWKRGRKSRRARRGERHQRIGGCRSAW